MGVWAIDVAHYQGNIDWRRVLAAGVRGAWIKIGGADVGMYKDSLADRYISGAEEAGMIYGTYYFCDTRGGPVTQARHAVSIGLGRGKLWPMADLETNPGGLSQANLDIWLKTFCDEVWRLIDRATIWYGNPNVGVGYTDNAPQCPVWVANYGQKNTPGTTPPNFSPRLPPQYKRWHIWQFNSVTNVPGIDNEVDQNVVADDFWAQMMNDTQPEDEDEMAQCVILSTRTGSKWGKEVAGYGVEGQAEYMAYPGSGNIVWIPSPDVLDEYKRLGVEHRLDVDDNIFYAYSLQPHDGRPGRPVDQAALADSIVAEVTAWINEHGIDITVDDTKLNDLANRVSAAGAALSGSTDND